MAITRDRLGRFAGNGGRSSAPKSKRQDSKSWNKNERTQDERIKSRIGSIVSKRVSKVMQSSKRGSMKLAERIQTAARRAKSA